MDFIKQYTPGMKEHNLADMKGNPGKDGTYSADQMPNLTGKVFIVTGGSRGVGFGAVTHLVTHNASKVYLLSTGAPEVLNSSLERLEALSPGLVESGRLELVKCDLRSLKETDRVAKELTAKLEEREKGGRLDCLMANAGRGVRRFELTDDGLDSHFEINHLSQMHLILTLLPVLMNTAQEHGDARIVVQASNLHAQAPKNAKFDSVEDVNKDLGNTMLYNRSKLCNILFTHSLNKHLQHLKSATIFPSSDALNSLYINTTHPGFVGTDQQQVLADSYLGEGTNPDNTNKRNLTRDALEKFVVEPGQKYIGKDAIEEGCLTLLYAGTSEEIKAKAIKNKWITPPCQIAQSSDQSRNETLAENLWNLSQNLIVEKLGKDNVAWI